MYKLVCSDIDGTLLDKDRELAMETITQIRRVRHDLDIPFVLISARMPSAMHHLQEDLGFYDSYVCYNGSLIYAIPTDSNTEQLVHNETIPASIPQQIFAQLEGTTVHMSIFIEDNWYVSQYDYWAKREERNTKVKPTLAQFDKFTKILAEDAQGSHKIMLMGDAEDIEKLDGYLRTTYKDDIAVYRSKDTYIEINVKSASKKEAIDILRNFYAVKSEEVVAFGDNYNDVEMIDYVGMGVAVANAREEVKSVANIVTAETNKEHGVANGLKKIF